MNKKYWLRGGFAGLVVLLIMVIISMVTDAIIHPSLFASSDAFQTPMVFLILVPEWFVYGAVLGWLYGKVTKKSENTPIN
jgi:p-aminobenzoyl-glutamate transporter AbgT